MFALLSPRLWIALALVGVLAFTHLTAYNRGKTNVQREWQAATAAANVEARQIEQHRQTAVDKAAVAATTRNAGIRADSARAGDAVSRLRDAIAARRMAEESASAATKRADTLGELLVESASVHRELAESCDRHVSDLRLLLEAWPR